MEKFSLIGLATRLATEADAWIYLERLRWNGEPVCPHCGVIGGHYFLTPKNGISRTTSRGTQSQRRTWKCKDCRRQFSVTTGTVMHGSHIPLRTWVLVFFEMASSKNGISAREIERKYGITPRSAWHLTQRIREAMRADNVVRFRNSVVVADETWIGGKAKNKHANRRPKVSGIKEQTPVVSLVNLDMAKKEVRSQVVPDTSAHTLRKVLTEQVVIPEISLFTDDAYVYRKIGREAVRHVAVNHSEGEYVRKGAGTNAAENYFSQLKRSLDGTHHQVSPKHLHRYLAEFDYRLTTCKESDSERMAAIVRKTAGKRLSYDELRGTRTMDA